MKEPWQAYMQLGIVHFMAFGGIIKGDGPIIETARRIAHDDFFEVLEVGLVTDPAVLSELKNLARASGLALGVGGQPGLLTKKLNLANLNEEGRQAAVAQIKTSIDQAYFLGSKLMAFLDGPQSYPGADKAAQAKAQLTKSVKELCAYTKEKATDYTLFLSLETFDRAIDKKSLMGPNAEAAAFAKEIRKEHDNFGLTVDLSHLPLQGETSEQALTVTQDYLVHAHVGNCLMRDKNHPAYGDYHPPFGIPDTENGVPELVEFLRVLFKIGYFNKKLPTGRPVVTFEVKPMPGDDSETLLAATKRVWRLAWAQLKVD
jgi:sugar phosphate isomerase/epimerase